MASESVPLQAANALQLKHYLDNSTVQTRWEMITVNITGFREPVYLDDIAKRVIELSKMILTPNFHVRDRVSVRKALDKVRRHYLTSNTRRKLTYDGNVRAQIEGNQIEQRLRGFTKQQLNVIFPRKIRWFLKSYCDTEMRVTLYLVPYEDLVGYLRRQSAESKAAASKN